MIFFCVYQSIIVNSMRLSMLKSYTRYILRPARPLHPLSYGLKPCKIYTIYIIGLGGFRDALIPISNIYIVMNYERAGLRTGPSCFV